MWYHYLVHSLLVSVVDIVVLVYFGSARKKPETTQKHVQCRFNGGMFILEPAEPKFQKLRERLLDNAHGRVETVFVTQS